MNAFETIKFQSNGSGKRPSASGMGVDTHFTSANTSADGAGIKNSLKAAMIKILVCALLALFSASGFAQSPGGSEEGVAVAIIYDTSGSMREHVRDGSGKNAAKYVIANRALTSVINRLEKVATASTNPRKIEAGIVIFDSPKAREAVPFGPFHAEKMRQWVRSFSVPDGGTPLGEAMRVASVPLLKSHLRSKHILVITDGINNVGPQPSAVIKQLKKDAAQKEINVSFHFIAFNVAASVFEPVKANGATVVAASDEKELNTQLSYIVEKKILLEDEEPPTKNQTK